MISEKLTNEAKVKFEERKEVYAPIWKTLTGKLSGCTEEEQILLQFLYGTMPARDAGEYPMELFLSYVRHALWLREHVEWCRELPEDLFVQHVLYYRINSEDISDCRSFFYELLKDRIAGLSMKEAVIELNYWCAEHAVYQASDERTISPLTMYRCGLGRCGEESTFTVSVFRSVGIPARQVYTPRWAHCDDNHAWVEVYADGAWHFLGACEPEEVLDRGWFAEPASRGMLIHSRTFGGFTSDDAEEQVGKEDLLVYYNHTSMYAKTSKVTVGVMDADQNPIQNAKVEFLLMNMAERFPIATLFTDEKGEVSITLGRGDVYVRVQKDALFAETLFAVTDAEKNRLTITPDQSMSGGSWVDDTWKSEELHAPKAALIHPGTMTKEQEKQQEERNALANQLREIRLSSFYQKAPAAEFPQEDDIFHLAGGNFYEVYSFLKKDASPLRAKLLRTLSKKDYKDLKAEILEDHLSAEQGAYPDDIFASYILCPRVVNEEMTAWRKTIREFFDEKEQKAFQTDPASIWTYIQKEISCQAEYDYPTICATPVGCLRLKQGNEKAKKVLFVAICRTLGIAARWNPVDQEAEYCMPPVNGRDSNWIAVSAAQELTDRAALAHLELLVEDGSKWNYFQTWSIGRWTAQGFVSLDYYGSHFDGNAFRVELEPGIYRLLTTNRMPNGNQQTESRCFALAAGEKKTIRMSLAEQQTDELLKDVPLEDFEVHSLSGQTNSLSSLLGEKPAILVFLGVGAEPTEHVLNEILELKGKWAKFQETASLIFLLRKPEDRNNQTLKKVLSEVSGIQIYLEPENQQGQKIALALEVSTDQLPVAAVIRPPMRGMYGCSGYHVGSVDLMMKIAEQ